MQAKYKDKIVSIIHKHLPGCKIYLFGRRLKEQEGEYVEVDIAVDSGSKVSLGVIGNIDSDISRELMPVDVDLVDINSVSQDFRETILKKGAILHK